MRSGLAVVVVTVAASAAAVTSPAGRAAPVLHPTKPATATTKQPTGHGHGRPTSGSAQGIVQSVTTGTIVLAELDGSTVSIRITAGTRVFVDGRHAGVSDVEPGFVASVSWLSGKARVLQAFDLSSAGAVGVGVVRSVSAGSIVVRRSDGSTVRIRIGPHTRVLLDGDAATLRAVTPGDTVVFTAANATGRKPAAELRFLRPV